LVSPDLATSVEPIAAAPSAASWSGSNTSATSLPISMLAKTAMPLASSEIWMPEP
jgi:hypothetical protein